MDEMAYLKILNAYIIIKEREVALLKAFKRY
jgi:hypothetical protein